MISLTINTGEPGYDQKHENVNKVGISHGERMNSYMGAT